MKRTIRERYLEKKGNWRSIWTCPVSSSSESPSLIDETEIFNCCYRKPGVSLWFPNRLFRGIKKDYVKIHREREMLEFVLFSAAHCRPNSCTRERGSKKSKQRQAFLASLDSCVRLTKESLRFIMKNASNVSPGCVKIYVQRTIKSVRGQMDKNAVKDARTF